MSTRESFRDMATDDTTKITQDGLRYKSKKGGSPFGTTGLAGSTMSCIKCGLHKPRASGTFRKLLGTSMLYALTASRPNPPKPQNNPRVNPRINPLPKATVIPLRTSLR